MHNISPAPALLKSLAAGILLSLLPASQSFAVVPDWAYQARIANLEISVEDTDQEIDALIALRKSEKVSVLEIDSGLSIYLTQAQFNAQVALLQKTANKAHAQGLKAVIYITSLEVNTKNGETLPNSMFKDHPDWVQRGFNNTPAVFYGSQEDWVEPGEESAWMSPNSGYRNYFIQRIKQLAASGLDGVWIDVPIYREIDIFNWGGLESGALSAFKAWSISQGLGGANGYNAPTAINWNDPLFRAWITWRHENLANFVEEIRQEALAVDPDFLVITEVFPIDDMDATSTGLDKGWSKSNQNHFSVWEIDSVSFKQGMKWSSIEDYRNKIAMYKWARSVDRDNPSWAFSYGNEEKDAGLVMGTSIATGVAPFESKTPGMTNTVSSAHRQRWFGFIGTHKQALLQTPRQSKVAVWYSSASRDFHDFKTGGAYGMYGEVVSPNNDPEWWADSASSSIFPKPHLGGYRGASNALIKLHIPYKVISDPGEPVLQLDGVKFLWLPSVTAISNASATAIKNFVSNGGTVFATGEVPGTLDEYGNTRSQSVLKDLFNLANGTPKSRANINFGSGVAIYRPDIKGREFFAGNTGLQLANENLSDLEKLVRIHAEDEIIVDAVEGVHVEIAHASATKKYLYVLNYSGLKQPLVSNLQNVAIQYRAPKGYRVASVTAYSPDGSADTGSLTVSKTASQWYQINPGVDQFTLIELNLAVEASAPSPDWPVPNWPNNGRRDAARSGLDFVLNKMRHLDKPAPYTYGVYTNLLNTGGLTEIYAHGHHVSAEHMGLTLRTSACMGDNTAWQQSYQFVREVMADPMYHVVNWAVDRDRLAPLVDFDDGWLNANAPLDDFRVIRGLMEGHQAFNQPEADQLGETLLTGLLRTSVTDQEHTVNAQFPGFPNGLVGYAWNWLGTTDTSLTPVAMASSVGLFSVDPVPVDYNDLYMMAEAAKRDPRWLTVLQSSTAMLLNSEIPATPGLFYNGYQANGQWTGDFENRDINQGLHFKTIQGLWIALHLARASTFSDDLLPAATRLQAQQAASRSLAFFKNFYQTHARVPEYFSFSGQDIPDCTAANVPNGCLKYTEENLFNGEARIYAQLARLALLLKDPGFAATLIDNHIMTDRVSNPNDPRYGQIGVSTASANDAEAWNVLESVLTLCEEATYQGSATGNQAPVASGQSVTTGFSTPVSITLTASDVNQDNLSYTVLSQPIHGSLSGNGSALVYTPSAGYNGIDSFSFNAHDGQLSSNTAIVNITVQAQANLAPVANHQTVTTHQDLSANIVLVANDANNDVLTYMVATQPTHGTLSGTGSNLTYTPNTGYIGSDSFMFQASDGLLTSNNATVTLDIQALSGQTLVANKLTGPINIDADLADWSTLIPFVSDPNDVTGTNNKIDWLRAWMAHDNNNLYIAYQNDGPVDNTNSYWWGWQVYIDLDNNPNTGYLMESIGAELVIEGDMLSQYTGTGDDWSWIEKGAASRQIHGSTVEMKFPRTLLGNPQGNFRVIFVGENSASNGSGVDWYPNGIINEAASVRYFTYQLL